MSDEKLLTLGSGRTLFKQGEKGGDLYFIKSGSVELTVRDEATGQEAVVATVGGHSVLGTMSFLEGDPRSATAVAKSEIKYVQISQVQRDRLLAQVPSWLAVLIKDLSQNLRRTNEQYLRLNAENELMKKRASQTDRLEKELEAEKEKAKKAEATWKTKEEKYQKDLKELSSRSPQPPPPVAGKK